jgi:hypothetical protein
MINFGPKSKISKKPKAKKAGKTSSRVLRRPEGYFKDALTPEDIAEINLFSRLIAENNAKHR